jgi:hypothetical protein
LFACDLTAATEAAVAPATPSPKVPAMYAWEITAAFSGLKTIGEQIVTLANAKANNNGFILLKIRVNEKCTDISPLNT